MKKSKQRVKGTVSTFSDQGSEGIHEFTFDKDGKEHWEYRIHLLEAGDYLVIYNEDDSVAFKGKIKPDYKRSSKVISFMKHGQSHPFVCCVSWIQKGWKPGKWAKLFFHEPTLRAILKKKERKNAKR